MFLFKLLVASSLLAADVSHMVEKLGIRQEGRSDLAAGTSVIANGKTQSEDAKDGVKPTSDETQILNRAGYTPIMDENGWVSVERPEKIAYAEGADERDPSIWVVFSKQLGEKKILVSFPDEPTYRYPSVGDSEIEVTAFHEGSEFRFFALDEVYSSPEEILQIRLDQVGNTPIAEKRTGETSAELLFWEDGFWIQETFVRSDTHTFVFQTKSPTIESDLHRQFVSSFHHFSEGK